MLQSLNSLYTSLTSSLVHAGTRSLAEGQTTAELMVESAMTQALIEPIQEMYRYPFRYGGVEAVPDTSDRDEMAAWLLAYYSQDEAAADLRAVLPVWMIRAINVGGQLGLEELGAGGVFFIKEETIKSDIAEHATGLTALGGYHSLVDTTVNELTIQLSNARLSEMTDDELNAFIAMYITSRSYIRAGAISLDQVILWLNVALREVYQRNRIRFEIFRNRPEASQTGPCQICGSFDGTRYPIGTGPSIPIHNRCVCVYLPDKTNWALPEEVWRG